MNSIPLNKIKQGMQGESAQLCFSGVLGWIANSFHIKIYL